MTDATPPSGRIAIVTGGSRGIGRGIVEALLSAGDTVYFCARDENTIRETEAALRATHGERVTGRAVDVRDAVAVHAFVAEVIATHQRLDVLVNNAGYSVFAPVHELPVETFRDIIETNLLGPFYFIHAAAPKMIEQGHGAIINIGSVSSRVAIATGAAYNASKFGLRGLTDAAMHDLRHAGIRVTSIFPGSVATHFFGPETGDKPGDQSWKLQPEDLGQAVLDLLAFPDRVLPTMIELRPAKPKPR